VRSRDNRDQAFDELVGGEDEVRGSVEARSLERESYAAVFEQLYALVADRGASTVAQQLLEAIASVRGYADGCVEVEAFELCVMAQRLVVPRYGSRPRVSADRGRRAAAALAVAALPWTEPA
jgi:hypothetical protein